MIGVVQFGQDGIEPPERYKTLTRRLDNIRRRRIAQGKEQEAEILEDLAEDTGDEDAAIAAEAKRKSAEVWRKGMGIKRKDGGK